VVAADAVDGVVVADLAAAVDSAVLAEAVPVEEARAATGKPARSDIMDIEKQINELVERLKTLAGENLSCVALFGSAVSREFHAGFSDINVICVFRELPAPALARLAPLIQWWTKKEFPAPLLFTRAELARSADIFAIELFDIRQSHRLLYGEDFFSNLQVPMDLHRVQVESNLRTKLLTLRQAYARFADDDRHVRRLMLDSVSNFAILFRHALIAMGEQPAESHSLSKEESIRKLGARIHFDPDIFVRLLQVRAGKASEKDLDPHAAFAQYMEGIEKAIQAVDAL
jgi:predicted nucleotidyltransferase